MDKIGFRLNTIKTEQFAIIEDAYNSKEEDFSIATNLGFGVDVKNLSIISTVKIKFEQKGFPFLIIEVSCTFDVSKDFLEKFQNKKSIVIPKNFMAHLAMLTVGTTRGILHEKTNKTKFNDFILPTINVVKMIEKDAVFDK